MSSTTAPHLVLVISEDWYVASHRLPLIRAACKAGWRVSVATRTQAHADMIHAAGADVISLSLSREGRNPLRELAAMRQLRALYQRLKPDVVHHVGIKPMLYGGWAARRMGISGVVQAFAGMGALYSDEHGSSAMKLGVERFMRPVTNADRTLVVVQNDDDADLLGRRKLAQPSSIRVVRGSGVDLTHFAPHDAIADPNLVILPARMLADKGVLEFVDAAKRLRGAFPHLRMALVGGGDHANPSAIAEAKLLQWAANGVIEWWQHRTDMAQVINQAAMVVLPSYREGFPKVLLEAAACGKAIVTTDVPGCRDVVQQGVNGLLVPPRDPVALADAIALLLHDPARRAVMGNAGRQRAEREFSDELLARQTIAIYEELRT